MQEQNKNLVIRNQQVVAEYYSDVYKSIRLNLLEDDDFSLLI